MRRIVLKININVRGDKGIFHNKQCKTKQGTFRSRLLSLKCHSNNLKKKKKNSAVDAICSSKRKTIIQLISKLNPSQTVNALCVRAYRDGHYFQQMARVMLEAGISVVDKSMT